MSILTLGYVLASFLGMMGVRDNRLNNYSCNMMPLVLAGMGTFISITESMNVTASAGMLTGALVLDSYNAIRDARG